MIRYTRKAFTLITMVACSGFAACLSLFSPVEVSSRFGISGWFQLDTDAAAALVVQRETEQAYEQRFSKVALGLTSPPCEHLLATVKPNGGPVYVLVHGVQGDHDEWHAAFPLLLQGEPAAIYMFRWVAYDERDPLVERFATGMSRLHACLYQRAGPMVVVAHSAGGVIAALGASRISFPSTTPEGDHIYLVTIASPLAGTVDRSRKKDGSEEVKFIFDLGSRITSYPAASRGVAVAHLRTQFPADKVMRPTKSGHMPNDPTVAVPNSKRLDLPKEIGHTEALIYASNAIGNGTYKTWFAREDQQEQQEVDQEGQPTTVAAPGQEPTPQDDIQSP